MTVYTYVGVYALSCCSENTVLRYCDDGTNTTTEYSLSLDIHVQKDAVNKGQELELCKAIDGDLVMCEMTFSCSDFSLVFGLV